MVGVGLSAKGSAVEIFASIRILSIRIYGDRITVGENEFRVRVLRNSFGRPLDRFKAWL